MVITSLTASRPVSTDIQRINSLSYPDTAGIYHGLDRLPGESNREFAVRLARAATVERSATYQGMINEIAMQFGLSLTIALDISSDDPGMTLTVKGGHVTVSTHGESQTFPLFQVDADSMLEWILLSDVVREISAINGMAATLLVPDAPALQLVEQSNLELVVGESVSGPTCQLAYSSVILGSESFSAAVPRYTLDTAGNLHFDSPPAAGTTITYLYLRQPCHLLAGELAVFPLAYCPLAMESKIPHQVREAVAYIMNRDRSYWSK